MLKKNNGTSLIELIIALFLSTVLIGAFFRAYELTWDYYRYFQAETANRQAAIFAFLYLREGIWSAGYVGCASPHSLDLHYYPLKKFFTIYPDFNGNDAFEVISRSEQAEDLESFFDRQTLILKKSRDLKPGWFILSDCYHAEAIYVQSVDKRILRTRDPLLYFYPEGAEVGRLVDRLFYIDHFSKETEKGLFVRVNGHSDEWVKGVRHLFIEEIKTNRMGLHLDIASPLTSALSTKKLEMKWAFVINPVLL